MHVTGETRFGLLERTRASDLIRREPTEGGPAGEVLFLVDDVDAETERLRGLGVVERHHATVRALLDRYQG